MFWKVPISRSESLGYTTAPINDCRSQEETFPSNGASARMFSCAPTSGGCAVRECDHGTLSVRPVNQVSGPQPGRTASAGRVSIQRWFQLSSNGIREDIASPLERNGGIQSLDLPHSAAKNDDIR